MKGGVLTVDFERDGIPVTSLADRREYLAVQLMVMGGGDLTGEAELELPDSETGDVIRVENGDWLVWREGIGKVPLVVKKTRFALLFEIDPSLVCTACQHPCHKGTRWGHRGARCARGRVVRDPVTGQRRNAYCWCAPCRCRKCC
jgi:hypothetical protein